MVMRPRFVDLRLFFDVIGVGFVVGAFPDGWLSGLDSKFNRW